MGVLMGFHEWDLVGSNGISWDLRSGKLAKSYGKWPFLMRKSTINGAFSIAMS